MNLILIVVVFVGVIMMSKNFLHLKFGRISENDIELLEFVLDKFFIGVILATSPLFLRTIGEVFFKKKMPPTMFNIFFLIIIIGSCLIILLKDYVNYRESRKSVLQEDKEQEEK